MRKLFYLIICLVVLVFGSNAIASTDYMLAKKDKAHKEKKVKKEKKQGPSERAYERANPNAKFKRYDDYTPQEKERLGKKRWGDMTEDEQDTVEDEFKKSKDKLDKLKKGKERLDEILK